MEFDIKLTAQEMYRFNLYHTYSGFHGISSILIGIFVFFVAGRTYGSVELMYTLLYVAMGILFLVYTPVSLYLSAKRQIATSEVFQKPLHFSVTEEKIESSQGEQSAQLLWEQIYKIVETKTSILVYSSRRNAFVLPKTQLNGQQDAFCDLCRQKLPAYRLKFKK